MTSVRFPAPPASDFPSSALPPPSRIAATREPGVIVSSKTTLTDAGACRSTAPFAGCAPIGRACAKAEGAPMSAATNTNTHAKARPRADKSPDKLCALRATHAGCNSGLLESFCFRTERLWLEHKSFSEGRRSSFPAMTEQVVTAAWYKDTRLAFAAWTALGAAVLAAAAAGSSLSLDLLTRGAPAGQQHAAPANVGAPEIGRAIPTSFGSFEVASAIKTSGLTAKALAGRTHGVHSLVKASNQEVTPSVLLTNGLKRTLQYSPRWFSLRVGNARKTYPVTVWTRTTGSLVGGANIELNLGFVAPRKAGRVALLFRDPVSGRHVSVDLGRSYQAPAGVDAGYHKH